MRVNRKFRFSTVCMHAYVYMWERGHQEEQTLCGIDWLFCTHANKSTRVDFPGIEGEWLVSLALLLRTFDFRPTQVVI